MLFSSAGTLPCSVTSQLPAIRASCNSRCSRGLFMLDSDSPSGLLRGTGHPMSNGSVLCQEFLLEGPEVYTSIFPTTELESSRMAFLSKVPRCRVHTLCWNDARGFPVFYEKFLNSFQEFCVWGGEGNLHALDFACHLCSKIPS